MATTDNHPAVMSDYLERLEAALAGLPSDVSGDILAEVREELTGLDADAAAARIVELGDPAFIAAEAHAETPEVGPPREPFWYPVVASILVAVGGILVPVLGWIVGIAMVWLSRTWRRWEKLVATLVPLVAIGLALLVDAITRAVTAPATGGEFSAPTDLPVNPLMPTPFDSVFSSILLAFGLNVVVGVWLLWQARVAHNSKRTGTK